MSKLAEHIKTTVTNKRIVNNDIDFSVEFNTPPPIGSYSYKYRVKFQAIFGKEIYIDEGLCEKDSPVLQYYLNIVKRSVIEEIFGEFRVPLIEIRHSLLDRNIGEAMIKLEALEAQMFKE